MYINVFLKQTKKKKKKKKHTYRERKALIGSLHDNDRFVRTHFVVVGGGRRAVAEDGPLILFIYFSFLLSTNQTNSIMAALRSFLNIMIGVIIAILVLIIFSTGEGY